MIYPQFIKEKDRIGICAPSAGVGHKLDRFEESNRVLKKKGYRIKETASVRRNNVRSASGKKRASELKELIEDKNIKLILCAAGGDYMLEMMPYVDFESIRNNPKWICGMSDPTNLLYAVTTGLDIATIYGFNGSGFVEEDKSQEVFFNIIKGNIPVQKSYNKYLDFLSLISDERENFKKVRWVSKDDVDVEGRIIGGCIDVIGKLVGTKFDKTRDFIERYKDDGIIWYFDNFALSAYDFYLTLLQFKNAGYFEHCKAVLIGRTAFERIDDKKLDYHKAADKALGKIAHIMEMDIGHTDPGMTIINGAKARVKYHDGKGSIALKLE